MKRRATYVPPKPWHAVAYWYGEAAAVFGAVLGISVLLGRKR